MITCFNKSKWVKMILSESSQFGCIGGGRGGGGVGWGKTTVFWGLESKAGQSISPSHTWSCLIFQISCQSPAFVQKHVECVVTSPPPVFQELQCKQCIRLLVRWVGQRSSPTGWSCWAGLRWNLMLMGVWTWSATDYATIASVNFTLCFKWLMFMSYGPSLAFLIQCQL